MQNKRFSDGLIKNTDVGAGIVLYWEKLLLACDSGIPCGYHVPASQFSIQFPTKGLANQRKKAQVPGPLPPTRETQKELQAPDISLAQPRPLLPSRA